MNARTRTVLHVLAAAGSIGIAGLVAWAWLSPQVRLDTALTLAVFLVPWVVIGGPYLMHLAASARSERHAQELWREHRGRARRFAGTVADRDVRTTDEGQVSLFRVRVTGLPAAAFPAVRSRPRGGPSRSRTITSYSRRFRESVRQLSSGTFPVWRTPPPSLS